MNLKAKIPLQKKVEFINWTVLGVFLLLSWFFTSASFTLGILAGGLISILNFFGLCRGLQSLFGNPEDKGAGKALAMLKYLSRLAITGVILYLVLVKTTADIFGLVIGLSTVVFSVIISVIMTLFDKSYLEEV
jgi:hypothetical protein